MTAKHSSPEWRRTCRIIREQVRKAHRAGQDIQCWRCGGLIPEDDTGKLIYDVGHLDPHGGEGLDNASPEHRVKTGSCIGNRAHGGKIGARLTNARLTNARKTTSTFRAPAWA